MDRVARSGYVAQGLNERSRQYRGPQSPRTVPRSRRRAIAGGSGRQSPQDDLILRVRALIEAGALPATNSRRVWAGKGDGSSCRICTKPISPEQFEFELDGVRLHRYCYDIWLQEVGTSQSPP